MNMTFNVQNFNVVWINHLFILFSKGLNHTHLGSTIVRHVTRYSVRNSNIPKVGLMLISILVATLLGGIRVVICNLNYICNLEPSGPDQSVLILAFFGRNYRLMHLILGFPRFYM